MEGRLTSQDVAFDGAPDDDDERAFAPLHYLEDLQADPATNLEQADWEENSNNGLYAALENLDERSRDIVQQRWLSEAKATLHELAGKYGVSAERIRQLEQNAMRKVKASLVV